jgi:cytochrome b6-f complex iron-sulfur subunit
VRWTRRRFLAGTTAAACIGCSTDSTTGSTSVPEALGADEAAPPELRDIPVLGTSVEVGSLTELRAASTSTYVPEARAWLVVLTEQEAEALAAAADESLSAGLEHGVLALWQKCPHLGCRVPFCDSSGWFECMCHGTMYNRAGEHRGGPGPRGLDAHPTVVVDDVVSIDVGQLVRGFPAGTVVLKQAPSGPHCVGDADY